MNFENVSACVGKLYTAALLQIISGVFIILAAIFGSAAIASGVTALLSGSVVSAAGTAFSGILAALLGIAIFVISIIVIILQLTGLHKASGEDPMFRYAFIASIAGLALSFLYSIISIIPGLEFFTAVLNFVISACSSAVLICSVLGIRNAAQTDGRTVGTSLAAPIIVIQCIVFVLTRIGQYITVFSLIGSVLSLVVYIIYFVFLTRAKNNI